MFEFRLSATLETKNGRKERRSYIRNFQAISREAANDMILRAFDFADYVDQTETPPAGDPDAKGS